MTEDYGEGNLIASTESFLNDVFESWVDSIKVLETCEEFLPLTEELHIVCRCIDSLAAKACTDPSLLSWSVSGRCATQSQVDTSLWNRINLTSKQDPMMDDWWHEDVASLQLSLFKRLILVVGSKGMSPERIAGSIMFYAKRHLPLHGRKSSFQNCTLSNMSDANHRTLLEEIVELLPNQKGIIPTKFLLKLLRTSIILHTSPSCRENLERRIGAQLDQAVLEDLLIPNTGYSVETLYDIDSIQRIVGHFMSMDQEETDSTSNSFIDEDQFARDSYSLTPMTMVANLVDSYLAEVAPDVNLKLTEFLSLAAIIPNYARSLHDGIYRAIDIYLKAHPWLTDSEREQLCRVMNFQKFSVEASTHAAQNERLPLRIIIQVLFFEQLRLRTSVAGCFYVSDNLEDSQNLCGKMVPTNDCIPMSSVQDEILTFDDMRERVAELEKECKNVKEEMEKLVKTKGSCSNFFRKFSLKFKARSSDQEPENAPSNGEADCQENKY
ncbi:Hypothetical predicted protein [Olea europaea subsp. europaea]|nr:Hypothetical predicted protein [Olea europaea subsp. europaea]